ncbi:MAG: hypothetical protein KC592_12840 [Nitrospira sp.]|nr:hypothetical protein [Nitrospira sp.]HBP88004.1 hypothetical protein [Nitrospiraceae bacterium]HNP30823.1 hypothetical protein [Nitrospirales bacterium]
MEPLPTYKSKVAKALIFLIIATTLIISLSGFLCCGETPVPSNPPTPVPAGATPLNGPAVPPGAICTAAVGETCTKPGDTCWLFDTCTNIFDTRTGECRCACL